MPLFHHGHAWFISSRKAQCPDLRNKSHLPQSSSASRLTAAASGFLNFSQSGERPDQVGSQRGLSRNMSSNFEMATSQWADEP